jgi:hypothetical protein
VAASTLTLLAAAASALVLAACGGSNSKPPHAGQQNKQLALAQCMRARGINNFPDPTSGPGGEGLSIMATPGSQALTVNGVTFSGPAFTNAEKACKLFGGAAGPPPISEKQKEQLVNFARCMRTHGVRDYADPTFPPGGGVMGGGPSNPSRRNAPQVRRAAKSCNRIIGL